MRQKTLSLKALVLALMLGLGLSGVTGVEHAQAAASDATTMQQTGSYSGGG